MKPLLCLAALLLVFRLAGQDTIQSPVPGKDYDKEFTKVDEEAQFPGGEAAWNQFLADHIKANTPAKHHAPAGTYTVVYSMLVDTFGVVKDVRVLENPGYGTAEDVIRVVKKSPAWTPAMVHHHKIIYMQKQKITYRVD